MGRHQEGDEADDDGFDDAHDKEGNENDEDATARLDRRQGSLNGTQDSNRVTKKMLACFWQVKGSKTHISFDEIAQSTRVCTSFGQKPNT